MKYILRIFLFLTFFIASTISKLPIYAQSENLENCNIRISNCPSNIVVNVLQNQCGSNVGWTEPIVMGGCGPIEATSTFSSGDFFPVGNSIVDYFAIDSLGNSSICSFTIAVVDDQPLVVICPTGIEIDASGNVLIDETNFIQSTTFESCGNIIIQYNDLVAFDNCSSTISQGLVQGLKSGAVFKDTTIMSIDASNTLGEFVSCTFEIIVQTSIFSANSSDSLNAQNTYIGMTCNDNNPNTQDDKIQEDCTCAGTLINNNCQLICNDEINVFVNSNGLVNLDYGDILEGWNCEPVPIIITDTITGNTFGPDTTVLIDCFRETMIATIQYEEQICHSSINIENKSISTPLALTCCPLDTAVIALPNELGAIVNWTPLSAISNPDNVTIARSHNSGDFFPIGKTTVTEVAMNNLEQSSGCEFQVTVLENSCRTRDSLTLVAIYNALNGPNWVNTWDLDQPIDTWHGIRLNSEGCVNYMRIIHNNLVGNLPDEIGNLLALEFLELGDNRLTGPIPENLGNLSKLRFIAFSRNQLNGEIPAFLGSFLDLGTLYLDDNQFEGAVPSSLSNLTRLVNFAVEKNNLSNPFIDLSNNRELEYAIFSNNKFTFEGIINVHANNEGTILDNGKARQLYIYAPQDSIYKDTLITRTEGEAVNIELGVDEGVVSNVYTWYKDGLLYQTIRGNNNLEFPSITLADEGVYTVHITNPIAPELTLYSRNITIQVEGIADNCRTRDSLILINLYNVTSGQTWDNPWDLLQPMDTWHGITLNQEGCVIKIDLVLNNLIGTIPKSLSGLEFLTYLDLGINRLSGTIPEEIGELVRLEYLSFGQNQLTGAIPESLGNLVLLKYLYLDQNNFTGGIPESFAQLQRLQFIHLYNCGLTGFIPSWLGNLSNVTRLFLQDNDLSGCFPENLLNLCSIGSSSFLDESGYNFTNNQQLPWQGNFSRFCNMESQIGAPCNDRDSNTQDDKIQEDCSCIGMSSSNQCAEIEKLQLLESEEPLFFCEDNTFIETNAYPPFQVVISTIPNEVLIYDLNEAGILIENLTQGSNIVTFSTDTINCTTYAPATIELTRLAPPKLQEDRINIDNNQSQHIFSVTDNDSIIPNASFTVEVFSPVSIGELDNRRDGTFTYTPPVNYTGVANFDYRLCYDDCMTYCDRATVLLDVRIEGLNEDGIVVPEAFTPNDDGVNDEFIIPILRGNPEKYPENELIIVNRWGDQIYYAKPYNNDWRGTGKNGKPLPAATYYYILRLDVAEGEIARGEVTLIR